MPCGPKKPTHSRPRIWKRFTNTTAPAGAFPVDFKGDPEGERKKINAWVEQQTNNRIRDLMPAGSIDAVTRLVLTNAIYFKGEWATPFDESSTKEEDFLTRRGTKVRAAMMHKYGLEGARYGAFNADGSLFATPRMTSRGEAANPSLYPGKGGFLVAELPYKGGDLTMVAIVPQDFGGLPALEENSPAKNCKRGSASSKPARSTWNCRSSSLKPNTR